jgi:long-chain acyl-CoA synthetase
VAVAIADPESFLLAALSVWEAGAALAPLDVRAGLQQARALSGRARARLLVTGADRAGTLSLEEGPAPGLLDPRAALLLFTSGSSGASKAVQLAAAGIRENLAAILSYLPLASFPRSALLLPLFYSYALVGQALATLRAQGTLLLLGDLGFPPLQLEAMERLGADGLSSVPTSLRLLARAALEEAGAPRPPLGYVASAGAPLDAATIASVRAAFPQARLFNQYGLTEASPRVTAIDDGDEEFARGSVGRPLPGIEVWAQGPAGRLPAGETGEIALRGPSVMLGYLDDAEATARALQDGALCTGDLGFIGPRGHLFVSGRIDGVVQVGGERVSVDEVAAAVRDCAAARDAAVVAVPDALLGMRLVAFVEAAAHPLEDLRRRLRQKLPAAKRPARIELRDSLPRTRNGKPDLAALRAQALGEPK